MTHLGHQQTQIVHDDLAAVRPHLCQRRIRLPVEGKFQRHIYFRQLALHQKCQFADMLCLYLTVRHKMRQSGKCLVDTGPRLFIGFQIVGLSRQEIAALAHFDVLHLRHDRMDRGIHAQGMCHSFSGIGQTARVGPVQQTDADQRDQNRKLGDNE